MERTSLRVLVGVVGAFAIARAVGQLNTLLQAVGFYMSPTTREFIIFDWITAIAVLAPLVLLGVGGALLGGLSSGVIDRLRKEHSFARALVGVAGVFLIVIGVEQIQPLSAAVGRVVGQTWYISRAWGLCVSLAIVLFPLGLGGLGFYLLRAHRIDTREGSPLAPTDLWQIAAMFAGALVLSFAMPRLSQIVLNFNLNYAPGALGTREYIAVQHWTAVLSFILEIALGVYLLLGAPRLVRWHMSRIGASARDGSDASDHSSA
jgi:hypothetical protein